MMRNRVIVFLAAEDEKCYYSSPGATGETLNTQIVLQC